MNFLYLIDRIETRGGTERHLYDLVQALLAAGHNVTVAVLQGGSYLDQFGLLPNIKIVNLQVKRIYDLSGIKAVYRLNKIIAHDCIDVVQTFHAGSDILGPIAAKITRRRVAIISSRRDMGYTKNKKLVFVQRFVNSFVDHILSNSMEVKKAVIANEGVRPDKISVIYNGIDFNQELKAEFVASLRKRYSLSGMKVIGSLGNIRPVKGYSELVEAASLIIEQYPNTFFMVAGLGVTDVILNRLKELNIEDKFAFIGPIDASEIYSFLSLLDIYVQPSRSEGFSNSVLEAMAAGLPVVVTDVGGNKEIVQDNTDGLTIQPLSPADLTRGLCFYMEHADVAKKYGENAKSKVLKEFTFTVMFDNYSGFYRDQIIIKNGC